MHPLGDYKLLYAKWHRILLFYIVSLEIAVEEATAPQ